MTSIFILQFQSFLYNILCKKEQKHCENTLMTNDNIFLGYIVYKILTKTGTC